LMSSVFEANSKEEKALKRERWAERAAAVPRAVAVRCLELLDLMRKHNALQKVTPSVRGDYEAGARLLLSAAQISIRNLELNTHVHIINTLGSLPLL